MNLRNRKENRYMSKERDFGQSVVLCFKQYHTQNESCKAVPVTGCEGSYVFWTSG
jgi:hypothetical protein